MNVRGDLVSRVLIILVIFLEVAHFALSESGLPIARLFDLDAEAGLGTWVSSALAFTATALAVLASIEARSRQLSGWYWWALLGLALLALSVDEVAQVHEAVAVRVGADLRTEEGAMMGGTPLLGIALSPALVVGPIALWRIGAPEARTLIVLGLWVFWIGAFGVEELEFRNFEGTRFFTQSMTREAGDFLLVGTQEVLELTGISLIFAGLLRQLNTQDAVVQFGSVSDSA